MDGAFDPTDRSVLELRSSWNAPDRSERYIIEHPIIAHRAMANRRGPETHGASLHPYIVSGLQNYKDECRSTGQTGNDLIEVPNRPEVLACRGSYHNTDTKPVSCTEEEDWHREGDIIWFGGSIYCPVNKAEGKYKGWTVEWWPDTVIRIAKLKVCRL